jgi:methionine--tRNA ligase beta chain
METIKFEDWKKIDLRVGEIKEVEDHPKADKLLLLKVDIGEKIINLVAGIKNYYSKEDLIGKKVIVFINLEPVVLRGIKSEGMILAADDQENNIVALLCPDKDARNGSLIR